MDHCLGHLDKIPDIGSKDLVRPFASVLFGAACPPGAPLDPLLVKATGNRLLLHPMLSFHFGCLVIMQRSKVELYCN